MLASRVQLTNHSIRELFPPLPLMRGGQMGTNRKGGVKKQHTLIGPAGKIAIGNPNSIKSRTDQLEFSYRMEC